MAKDRLSKKLIDQTKKKNIVQRKFQKSGNKRNSPDYAKEILSSLGNSTIEKLIVGGFFQAKRDPVKASSENREEEERDLTESDAAITRPLREFFEPRLGVEWENVRIHTGENVNTLAETINGKAIEQKNNFVFNGGQYKMETTK